MADKSFGVKQVNLINASGTPRIESPNNLNINAVNVAISTDISVGGQLSLGTGTSISSPATNVLALGTNSVERLRITSSGNVGIGTDNPTTEFEVLGGGTVANFKGTGGSSSIGMQDVDDGTLGFVVVDGGNIKLQTSGGSYADKLIVDPAGRVTMPYQPGFIATSSSAATAQPGTGAVEDLGPRFDTIPSAANGGFNTGNHYNTTTGVFTAPVAGKYFTFFSIRWETSLFTQNSYIRIFLSKNSSISNYLIHQINGTNEAWNNYMAMSVSGVIQLAAGDTLRPRGGMSGGTAYAYWNESSWGAWLLG